MSGDYRNCRVCGYFSGDSPLWYPDGEPSLDYCPCCGFQAGFRDDSPEGIRAQRAEWLAGGGRWRFTLEPHDGLTTEERLTHVPPGFEDQP